MNLSVTQMTIHNGLDCESNGLWFNNISVDVHCEDLLHANTVVRLDIPSRISIHDNEVLQWAV